MDQLITQPLAKFLTNGYYNIKHIKALTPRLKYTVNRITFTI